MKKVAITTLLAILFISMFVVFTPKAVASENVIFQDDFESYAVGTFPSSGGWQIVWNGAGNQYQVITDAYSNSPTKSLQLEGSVGWSIVVKRDFSSSSNLIGYEGYLMSTTDASGAYGNGNSISFFNQPIATWGRYYADIGFWNGYIWAGVSSSGWIYKLQPFAPMTWYKIRVILDRTSRIYNVWIDDVLVGQNLVELEDPNEILSLQIGMGWQTQLSYFDDVKVFEVSGTLQDFEMSVSPTYQEVSPGKEADFRISLTPEGGFSESVSLSLSGLPSSAQYSFESSTLTPPSSTLLRIKIKSASFRPYRFTVTATSASKTHSADASVFVSPLPSPMSIIASFQFNPSKVAIGNAFKLILTVKNLGNEPAFGISVEIFVPTGFKMSKDHRISINMLSPGESTEMQFSILAPMKETTGVFDGKIQYYKNPTLRGTPLAGFVGSNSIQVVRGFLLTFNLWSPFPLTDATVIVTDHDRGVSWGVSAKIVGETGQIPTAQTRVAEAGNYGATATGEMEMPEIGSVPVWTNKETTFVVSSDMTIDLYLD
jgi:hypothetical protein